MAETVTTAPLVVFVYNRPAHTARTLAALRANDLAGTSDLYVFSDGAKSEAERPSVHAVRELLHTTTGFRSLEIVEKPHNDGLANSIIAGVSQVVRERGRAIVLEDDIVTSPYFLRYMNAALERYGDLRRVFSISGYNLPPRLMQFPPGYPHQVYFNPRPCAWGWATWCDRWQTADWQVKSYASFMQDAGARRAFEEGGADLVDWLVDELEGRVQSWDARWTLTHFLHGALAVYPVSSYVDNVGNDGSGINSRANLAWRNDLARALSSVEFPTPAAVDPQVMRAFRRVFLLRATATRIRRLLRRLLRSRDPGSSGQKPACARQPSTDS